MYYVLCIKFCYLSRFASVVYGEKSLSLSILLLVARCFYFVVLLFIHSFIFVVTLIGDIHRIRVIFNHMVVSIFQKNDTKIFKKILQKVRNWQYTIILKVTKRV